MMSDQVNKIYAKDKDGTGPLSLCLKSDTDAVAFIRDDLFANVLGALAEADAFILQETRFSNEGRSAIIAEASEALGVKIRLTKEGDA